MPIGNGNLVMSRPSRLSNKSRKGYMPIGNGNCSKCKGIALVVMRSRKGYMPIGNGNSIVG